MKLVFGPEGLGKAMPCLRDAASMKPKSESCNDNFQPSIKESVPCEQRVVHLCPDHWRGVLTL